MMIQTNASTVEFAAVAHVTVKMVQLEIGVKSNQPMATVILITINMNLSMMVETAAKVHVSVQISIHAAKMNPVLLTWDILSVTSKQSRIISGSRVVILSTESG